jgi:hypothetical protein
MASTLGRKLYFESNAKNDDITSRLHYCRLGRSRHEGDKIAWLEKSGVGQIRGAKPNATAGQLPAADLYFEGSYSNFGTTRRPIAFFSLIWGPTQLLTGRVLDLQLLQNRTLARKAAFPEIMKEFRS